MRSACSCNMRLELCIFVHCGVNLRAYSCTSSCTFVIFHLSICSLSKDLLVTMEVQCIQDTCWLEFLRCCTYWLCCSCMSSTYATTFMLLKCCVKLYLWDTGNTFLTLLSVLLLGSMEVECIQDWSWLEFIGFCGNFFAWSCVVSTSVLFFMLLYWSIKCDTWQWCHTLVEFVAHCVFCQRWWVGNLLENVNIFNIMGCHWSGDLHWCDVEVVFLNFEEQFVLVLAVYWSIKEKVVHDLIIAISVGEVLVFCLCLKHLLSIILIDCWLYVHWVLSSQL